MHPGNLLLWWGRGESRVWQKDVSVPCPAALGFCWDGSLGTKVHSTPVDFAFPEVASPVAQRRAAAAQRCVRQRGCRQLSVSVQSWGAIGQHSPVCLPLSCTGRQQPRRKAACHQGTGVSPYHCPVLGNPSVPPRLWLFLRRGRWGLSVLCPSRRTQGGPGMLLLWEGRDQDGVRRLYTQARSVQGSQSVKLPFN